MTDRSSTFFLRVAAFGAAMVATSIVTASIIGELSDALWWLLVPVGMLGGFALALGALAIHFGRRLG